jgi:hypothetical protein
MTLSIWLGRVVDKPITPSARISRPAVLQVVSLSSSFGRPADRASPIKDQGGDDQAARTIQ